MSANPECVSLMLQQLQRPQSLPTELASPAPRKGKQGLPACTSSICRHARIRRLSQVCSTARTGWYFFAGHSGHPFASSASAPPPFRLVLITTRLAHIDMSKAAPPAAAQSSLRKTGSSRAPNSSTSAPPPRQALASASASTPAEQRKSSLRTPGQPTALATSKRTPAATKAFPSTLGSTARKASGSARVDGAAASVALVARRARRSSSVASEVGRSTASGQGERLQLDVGGLYLADMHQSQ